MEETRELICIGGASASLSAAIYATRAGVDVTVIADEYGGQINNTDVVENYLGFESISGPELADRYVEHMRSYNVEEVVGNRAVDVSRDGEIFEVELENGEVFRAISVIVATGGSRRKLDIPGEKEFRNRGVAYCAVCDGPLYQGEEVAIIGGGYAGTEAAEYMSDVAEKVYLLCRSEELSGEAITIEKVLDEENVEVLYGAEATEFYGDDLLEGLKYEQGGELKELEVAAAFVEIGTVPNSDVCDLYETDEDGQVEVTEQMETGVEGLYAAGDVTNRGVQQLVVTAGQGCMAGLNAADYVKRKRSE